MSRAPKGLEPPPCIRHKQHQHGEDLQTAGQHIEDEHQLCGVCKAAEVLHWACHFQARADVVQGSSHGGKVCHHIKAVQADEEEGSRKNKDIRRHKHVGGADGLVVQQLAVHAGGRYHLRVQGGLELLGQGLTQNEETAHLDAAAGAARAGANEHEHDQNLFREGRPQVKIAAGKAGGGDDGAHLKSGLPQRLAKAVVHTINIGSDDTHCHCDDHKVAPHLLAGSSAAELAHEQQEVGVEVDAEQDHEDGHDPLDVGRKAGKAVVAEAEAAGARRTKGGEHGFEQGHSANQQEHQLQHGKGKVDAVQDLSGGLYLRHQLIHLRAGAFRLHQVDVGAAGQRQQREQKHQNTHAADPVGEAAPEQNTVGQPLHGGQDTGTGGGKAGDCLKQSIHRVRDAAGEHKGHRAHHRDEHPAQRGSRKAFAHIEHLTAGFDGVQGVADAGADGSCEQKHTQHHPLAIH